jgi:hypothetical protein
MRKTLAVAVGVATAFGISIANAPLASAHDVSATLYRCDGIQKCGYGGVTNNHTRVYACDTRGDGYGFRTWYFLRNTQNGYVDDPNGSDSGCGAAYPGTASNPVISFQVCSKQSPIVCGSEHYA